ncbi:hypothetical protein ABPG75_005702 [Micractinium tetrahymenae]
MRDGESLDPLDSAGDALEAQPILNGGGAAAAATNSHLYAADGGLEGPLDGPPPSRWRQFWSDPLVRTTAVNLALILTWYLFSTLVSLFNKLVMGKEHGLLDMGPFPAPFLLSSLQFFCQHIIARSLLVTGLVKRKSDGSQSWREYARKVVPNGVATGLDIGLSNYSLVYITLSFYVMCKSTTPLFLLVFAIAWGIEKPSWSLAAVVSVISAGLLLLVYGETKFHLVGFILVMSAAMLAGLRWTITQVLLQGGPGHGSRKHGGPVEVLFQLTPVMGITLLILSLAHEQLWETLPGSPYFASLPRTLLSIAIIFGFALVAFCMVVAEFALIANTSALTFMVAGTFKEIVTVAAAVIFLGENFTWVNGLGLLVLILGVVLFNWFKFRKLKQELAAAPAAAGAKLSDGDEGPGYGPPGGGEVDAANGGGSAGSEVELGGGFGGAGSGSLSPSPRRSGGVLMLGVREGFLLEDEQLLREASPRSPLGGSSWRSGGGGGAGGGRQRGHQPGSPADAHTA